ncbi:hypothetical protein GHV40_01085 [Devosia sp. D6-9]|nr:hypothetical protein GHV40_01085 [Devosia sp. D6-9]
MKIAVAEKGRKWREANPDKRREVDRVQHAKQVQRRQSDPVEMDRHREWVRKYHHEKRKVPRYRLDHRISQLVRNGLNGTKSGRTWESLVGYSIADLMVHLEKQFLPGMGWHNMHKWHVDHIIPRAHFDYRSSDDEEFKACWAMSNLRPLWSEDNIKKGASRLLLL